MLIKNVTVIDPAHNSVEKKDIMIENGLISGLGQYDSRETCGVTINAEGLMAAPGLADVHVHFRDPGFTYKEDIQSGALAAAKGGYTTVVCMANTKPAVDNPDTLRYVLGEALKVPIKVKTTAAVTKGLKGAELTDMAELKAMGAVGFTDDGIPLLDAGVVYAAMLKAKEIGVPLSFHEEDPHLIGNNGINRGNISDLLGISGSPHTAEDVMVARDCILALETGARVNIQHMSSAYAVEAVKAAKILGADIWAEASPHHFTLTEEAVRLCGAMAKMNPPLRTERDRQRIIEGLAEGTIDMIATDHAPHSKEEKEKSLTEAPSGIIGLETALALGITSLVDKGYLTLIELMRRMSLNPCRFYGFECGIGAGDPADIVIFDAGEEWVVKDFVSKSSNSPFVGTRLRGRVKYTICKGEVVYTD